MEDTYVLCIFGFEVASHLVVHKSEACPKIVADIVFINFLPCVLDMTTC